MCRTIWFLVILCGISQCILGKYFRSKDNNSRTYVTEDATRLKRGIALVDEDFDVPPVTSNGAKEYGGIFNEPDFEYGVDGSGGDESREFWSKEIAKSFITHLDAESEFSDLVNETTNTELLHKETEYIDVGNTTSHAEFLPKESKYDDVSIRTTTVETLGKATLTKVKITTKTVHKVNIHNSILVGSGDGMLPTNEYSSTEIVTETKQISITGVDDDEYEEISDGCLNSTCSVSDLTVQISEDTSLIPEGTNLTLTCRSNISDHQTLYWYQSNGSTYCLQTFSKNQELMFRVPNSRTFHSGKYVCVARVDKAICCNTEVHLTIYKVPLYKYHLIVLALISALGLLLCIFLGIRQSRTLKVYTKGFIQKHGDKNQQLLWN